VTAVIVVDYIHATCSCHVVIVVVVTIVVVLNSLVGEAMIHALPSCYITQVVSILLYGVGLR
jgi:hypothetical protein